MTTPQLLPDNDPAIAALAEDIDEARAESYPLVLAVQRPASVPSEDAPLLDALAIAQGYAGLGAGWIAVPRRIAAKILAHIIGHDLAYPDEIVAPEEAEALAGRFLALFPSGARYYTNGACSGEFAVYDTAGEEVLGWRSLSSSTLDNGVIAIAQERVGMLWAEDET